MNRLLLGLLFALATISVQAQDTTSIELTTKDGRTVILKPDGTWEFKIVTPQPSPTPLINGVRSRISSDSYLTNLNGQDIDTLIVNLYDLQMRLKKGEFETTIQFEKRIAEEVKKPILGNFTLEDTFSFVTSPVSAEYNADTQKMKYSLAFYGNLSDHTYTIAGFGDISREIVFEDTNELMPKKDSYSGNVSTEISLDVEDARRLKTTTKAVAIVKLEKPYLEGFNKLHVHLVDIYLFDPQTGKILAKMSETKR